MIFSGRIQAVRRRAAHARLKKAAIPQGFTPGNATAEKYAAARKLEGGSASQWEKTTDLFQEKEGSF